MAIIGNASSPDRQDFLWIMVKPSMAGGTGNVKTQRGWMVGSFDLD
jgi:hypothetical protein